MNHDPSLRELALKRARAERTEEPTDILSLSDELRARRAYGRLGEVDDIRALAWTVAQIDRMGRAV